MQPRHIELAAKLSPRLATKLLDFYPAADTTGLQAFRPAEEDLARADPAVGSMGQGAPGTRWLNRMSSLDGALASGVWESTAGSYEFKFAFDEWIHILEGEAHVTANGETHVLRAGDAVFFRAGLPMTWVVPQYVRKVWVHRYPRPGIVRRGVRNLWRIATARRGRAVVEGYALSAVLEASASFL